MFVEDKWLDVLDKYDSVKVFYYEFELCEKFLVFVIMLEFEYKKEFVMSVIVFKIEIKEIIKF